MPELPEQLPLWRLQFHFLHFPDLPHKHAGVGLARKIGMDMAAYRLEQVQQRTAPIVCFDADSRCAPNYLKAIETLMRQELERLPFPEGVEVSEDLIEDEILTYKQKNATENISSDKKINHYGLEVHSFK